jgi:ankyrin repeat protein
MHVSSSVLWFSNADVAAKDTESYTPLMLAAVAGHMEAFNVLLDRGSAIDETDEDGKTVVHLAAEKNHVGILMVSNFEVVLIMMESGCVCVCRQ